MPWRGPRVAGEFPTLGYQVGEWIQQHVVIPDGYRQGEPYLLTAPMWRFLVRFYRLDPQTGEFVYYGAQLRRAQKWGKDPFGAAIILAEALGPARFDRWDDDGEPVGEPYPTPYIPCLGVSEGQTDNTYGPLVDMIRLGPLINEPGMDAGQTRTELPNGGTIEPVTSSPSSRLGQRMTFATLTETHLWTRSSGGRTLAANVKRNIAGMDGRWIELTNAWDPSTDSEAEATATAEEPGVLIDNVESRRVDDLTDDDALRAELLRQYEDHARERGGWVNLTRIMAEIRTPRTSEADARRFFLNEIVAGEHAFTSPLEWAALARPSQLEAGDYVGLGFDGSRSSDSTALVAVRRADLRVFTLGVWERPEGHLGDWRVDRPAVRRAVKAAFDAYQVGRMLADPWRWENDLDLWAAEHGDDVVLEFPTNAEQRMDRAVHRWMVAVAGGELTHDANPVLTRHLGSTVLVNGGRKKARDTDDPLSVFYRKLAKRTADERIDATVAAVLAVEAAMTMPDQPKRAKVAAPSFVFT